MSWETNVQEKVQAEMSIFCQRKLVMDDFKGDLKHRINLLHNFAYISIATQI